MPERIVAADMLVYRTPEQEDVEPSLRASKGQTVDLSDEEIARIEEQQAGGAFALVPEGFEDFDAFHEYLQAVYRGQRGDGAAASRAESIAVSRKGGIVNFSEESSAATGYASAIENGGDALNVDETIALAQGDPAKAADVLNAEREVSGGKPRKSVVDALTKLISGGE